METLRRDHSFGKIINKDSKILILGSFPSLKSVEVSFYYGHPQNRFWDILAALYDEPGLKAYSNEKKTEFLAKNRIALYDVIDSCLIKGSSDLSIDRKSIVYTDILNLIKGTDIRKIFLNGNKAFELFSRKYPELADISVKLPSTSPANAKMRLDDLIEQWKIIKE